MIFFSKFMILKSEYIFLGCGLIAGKQQCQMLMLNTVDSHTILILISAQRVFPNFLMARIPTVE